MRKENVISDCTGRKSTLPCRRDVYTSRVAPSSLWKRRGCSSLLEDSHGDHRKSKNSHCRTEPVPHLEDSGRSGRSTPKTRERGREVGRHHNIHSKSTFHEPGTHLPTFFSVLRYPSRSEIPIVTPKPSRKEPEESRHGSYPGNRLLSVAGYGGSVSDKRTCGFFLPPFFGTTTTMSPNALLGRRPFSRSRVKE